VNRQDCGGFLSDSASWESFSFNAGQCSGFFRLNRQTGEFAGWVQTRGRRFQATFTPYGASSNGLR